MHSLIEELKEGGQDFEFYPTTNEIIARMVRDIKAGEHREYRYHRNADSVLDIGAGNGKVLSALKDADIGFREFYAIEKSATLCGELDKSIFVVGTAFEEQSLISKQVDVIFCNPPYSQFDEWATKIIRQSAAPLVYLVIPERWEKSPTIKAALKFRDGKVKNVGSFDFASAEDRQARAKVHLLRITLPTEKDDAFERFFAEEFAPLLEKFKKPADDDEAPKHEHAFTGLAVGENYPEAMVQFYNDEMAHIQRNYQIIGELDADLLREFEVDPKKIRHCLKERLSGLRLAYWNELFSKMRPITDRLTSKSRRNLLDTLQRHVHVDFTVSNIHAVLMWAIKNSNSYIESQLIDTYENMVDKCNVVLYKSNQKQFTQCGWRYNRHDDQNSHYALDYRIVMHRCGGLATSYGYSRWQTESYCGLEERAHEFLRDMLTIANNLGFITPTDYTSLSYGARAWRSNESHDFYYHPRDKKPQLLFDVKAFKNGNLHLRLSQKFALALNVEHGRLRGWLRSKEEAAEELQQEDAGQFFKSNHQLLGASSALLLSA